ncbi:DNA polymerase III subunit delta [Vibrio algarum]|uniref:DNA polymerase III subunit delta n=1 Tax=Vibrio algarum TaxID=3020714 RepID=A0ABT4YQB6_9VIBR|nr:DNA polymerase III subunit delta [Vibrio sp. KJ40-1]MDB1123224.1 DNA polymerase III subunit delta [Vibrio sp. KJ40-1]
MRIFADKLVDQLHRQLHSSYLVFGNEPLLVQESRDAIIATAKMAGFDEKHNFTIDNQINWNEVYDCCQALSLFSSRQIIELEVPETGINAAASKELVQLTESLHADILLLIVGSKLTKAQENAKWFKTLNQQGVWVSCLTPDIQRLPQFIQNRCRKLNLKPDAQALQMLAQWHEGNLLALAQSLEKLALLYSDGDLNLVRIEESLSRHNHFTPFHWMDALLAGKPKRAQRILRQLELEGIEPVILLRTFQRELNLITKLKSELSHTSIGAIFDKHRIWQSKRPLYSSTLQRLEFAQIRRLFRGLNKAEISTKTQYDDSVWPLIAQLSLEFCSATPAIFPDLPIQR